MLQVWPLAQGMSFGATICNKYSILLWLQKQSSACEGQKNKLSLYQTYWSMPSRVETMLDRILVNEKCHFHFWSLSILLPSLLLERFNNFCSMEDEFLRLLCDGRNFSDLQMQVRTPKDCTRFIFK